MRPTAILGPQRHQPCVRAALDSVAPRDDRPIALISAGWEERELEHDELAEHVAGRVANLEVFGRVEDVYRIDPELHGAVRARNDRIRRLQSLYRERLAHGLEAARAMLRASGDPDLIEPERADAIDVVRAIDRHHLERLQRIHHEFWSRWRPENRPSIARHRRELLATLRTCRALCVAGGHVAILLNRLRLLGVLDLLPNMPVVAWSAGAMALANRVVLFHDHPPQGAGNAEVFEAGLGLLSQVVVLPHAHHRLRLEDPARVTLLARRFAPDQCLALFGGERLEWSADRWRPFGTCRVLREDGQVVEVAA
ncbi:MAG: hypothetical protein AB7I19_01355 [Planctomycetota bacterium]